MYSKCYKTLNINIESGYYNMLRMLFLKSPMIY